MKCILSCIGLLEGSPFKSRCLFRVHHRCLNLRCLILIGTWFHVLNLNKIACYYLFCSPALIEFCKIPMSFFDPCIIQLVMGFVVDSVMKNVASCMTVRSFWFVTDRPGVKLLHNKSRNAPLNTDPGLFISFWWDFKFIVIFRIIEWVVVIHFRHLE